MRRIAGVPEARYFKPQGIPLRDLDTVALSLEEYEALRLRYVEDHNQEKCADHMHISQSSFQRTLSSALKKMSKAVVHGHAIRIQEK